MGDQRLVERFALADRLHKTLAEIDALTVEEIEGWRAYFLYLRQKKKG